MNIEANLKISEPEYFHREYQHDIPLKESGNYYFDQCKRITTLALPFLSLYKPFSFPLSLTLGGLRSFASLSQLLGGNGDLKESSYAVLQTVLSILALSATILAHPLGMLVTTVHDCALNSFSIGQNLFAGDFQGAAGSTANLMNNTLYLALILHGGLEIAIASLAMQVLIGLSHSAAEYRKGNYLEAGGHLLMGMIRGNQMIGQMQVLQTKWQIDSAFKKRTEELNVRTNQISQKSEASLVENNPQKLNTTTVHALNVFDGEFSYVGYYNDNMQIIMDGFAEQRVCQNGIVIFTANYFSIDRINGVEYFIHFYDNFTVYSAESFQYIEYF